MPLTRLTPLDGDAILSLTDARSHLRVRHIDEDALIGSLRDAAIAHVERVSGVVLAETDFRWTAPRFSYRMDLPVRPVTELIGVTYHDDDGEPVTYSGARLVDGSVLSAVNDGWPDAGGYAAIEFTAGLASPDDAPDLLAAVRLLLGHYYANREAVSDKPMSELPLAVNALIQTHRQVMV